MKRLRRLFFPAICSSLLLLSITFNLPSIAQQTSSPDADSMVLRVTVVDKKGFSVDGLDKNAFTLYDNKVPQEITYFAAADEPVSIGIILDMSGSQTVSGGKSINAVRNAILRLMELGHSNNQYFIIPFAGSVRLLIDWTRDSKSAAEEFSKYDFSPRSGNTALYDACYLAIEKMRTSPHSKRVLLLITDGQDNESQYTYKDVRERLKETGVRLYSIGVFDRDDGSALGMEGKTILDELSSIAGGTAYFPNNVKQIDEVFDRIARELRHQYLIGFKPSKIEGDDKWHQLKVKVTPPLTATGEKQNLITRTRAGYYPNQN